MGAAGTKGGRSSSRSFFRLTHSGFAERRKTLSWSNCSSACSKDICVCSEIKHTDILYSEVMLFEAARRNCVVKIYKSSWGLLALSVASIQSKVRELPAYKPQHLALDCRLTYLQAYSQICMHRHIEERITFRFYSGGFVKFFRKCILMSPCKIFFWRIRPTFLTSQGNIAVLLASWLNRSFASSNTIEEQSEMCGLPTMERSTLPSFPLLIYQVRICIVCKSARLRDEDHPDDPMINTLPMIQFIHFVAEEMAHCPLSGPRRPPPQVYHVFLWQDSSMRLVCSLPNSKSKLHSLFQTTVYWSVV